MVITIIPNIRYCSKHFTWIDSNLHNNTDRSIKPIFPEREMQLQEINYLVQSHTSERQKQKADSGSLIPELLISFYVHPCITQIH